VGAAPLSDTSFNYFGDNYRWSMALLLALGSEPFDGADIPSPGSLARRPCAAVTANAPPTTYRPGVATHTNAPLMG
jgi:hypothetical protein